MAVPEKVYTINGTGWRDHSRGPRGGNTGEPWGGHVIAGCLFPSGKAFIFSSYWRPDGKITLSGANVYDADGTIHSAHVVTPPRLTELVMEGEKLPIHLKWDGGEINTTMTTRRSIWTSMQKRLAVGKDLTDNGLMYVLNFGPCEWDGETGQVYIERSDPMCLPLIELKD